MEFDELKARLTTTWMAGNYDLFCGTWKPARGSPSEARNRPVDVVARRRMRRRATRPDRRKSGCARHGL